MASMASPYKLAPDSPSRQLLRELSQLAISNQKKFYAHLDDESREREVQHKKALAEASARHERVRKSAEEYKERIELEEKERIRKEEEESRRQLERQRQEKAAAEAAARKREEERAKAAELEARRGAEEKKARGAAAVEQQKREEEQRKAESERQLREAKNKIQESQQPAAPLAKPQDSTTKPQKPDSVQSPQPVSQPVQPAQPTKTTTPEHESEHARYLQIHKNLKELRQFMSTQAKQNPQLKAVVGEMRREIKKSVGQIRDGKGKDINSTQLKSIKSTLEKALQLPEPTINVALFFAFPPPQTQDAKGPALLIYLLNIFAKAIVAQFIDEAGVKPVIADNLGIAATGVFAADFFCWQGHSLMDILIAKMRVVCPVLFGIYGSDKTKQGRERLGWWIDPDSGTHVSEQRHFERMTGLSAGFASLSLRNFEKARAANPYPEYNYWKALARVTNVPPEEITQTHFVVLKGMVENFESKILHFFGDMGMAALRHALIELPKRSPRSIASKSLTGLVDVLRKDQKLYL